MYEKSWWILYVCCKNLKRLKFYICIIGLLHVQNVIDTYATHSYDLTCEWPHSDLYWSSWLTDSNALTQLWFFGSVCLRVQMLTAVIKSSTTRAKFCFVDYLVRDFLSSLFYFLFSNSIPPLFLVCVLSLSNLPPPLNSPSSLALSLCGALHCLSL